MPNQSRYYIPNQPEDERERIKLYLEYEDLYFGKNKSTFNFQQNSRSQAIYIANNFTRLLSEFFSDLIFSEPPQFLSDSNQESLDDIVEDTNLHILNMQSSVSNSYRGDAVYKVRRDEDGDVYIDDVPPMMFFPKFKDYNINEYEYIDLCWMRTIGDSKYVQKERHYTDRIENLLFKIVDDYNTNGEYSGPQEVQVPFSSIGEAEPAVQENPTGEFLVVHIPNYRISNYAYGISDIQSLDSLLNEADYRITQLASILNKHADPKLAVPKGVLNASGQVASGNLQMFEVTSNSSSLNKPEYITWDAQLESVFKEIELITERIALFGRMPVGLFKDKENMTAPEAAKALKLKFLMSLKKANRKRLYYDQGLKKVLKLAGMLMDVDLSDVRIKWNDGLPEDRLEELQAMMLEKQLGITSDETRAREYLNKKGMKDEQIDDEMVKINKQKADVMAPRGTQPVVTLPEKTTQEQSPANNQ